MQDFIVSYVESDRPWAEWIERQLKDAGYDSELCSWDYRTPHEALRKMRNKSSDGAHVVAVLSPNYLTTVHSETEWVHALSLSELPVLPIRVRHCIVGTLVQSYIDLVKLDHEEARRALIGEVTSRFGEPQRSPLAGQVTGAAISASTEGRGGTGQIVHATFHVPYDSHPEFVGREALLNDLYKALASRNCVALVQNRPGPGGTGRTQLAVEYANLYKTDYSVIWWMRAERGATLVHDFSALATPLDLEDKDADNLAMTAKSVRKWLSENSGWLLIFDSAHRPRSVAEFIPEQCKGHVLITSLNPSWRGTAVQFRVPPLERSESVQLLFRQTKKRNEGASAALAAALDDLPLPLNLASAFIHTTGITIDEYIDRLLTRHKEFWGFEDPPRHVMALTATALSLTVERLVTESKGAVDLLKACAYCAPLDIRLARFSAGMKSLPRTLAKTATNLTKLNGAVNSLKRYGLVQERDDALSMHRVVQAVIYNWLEQDFQDSDNANLEEFLKKFRYTRAERKGVDLWCKATLRLLKDAYPQALSDRACWHECAFLLPHVMSVLQHAERIDADPKTSSQLWNLLGLYLVERGDLTRARVSFEWALALHQRAYGPNHRGLGQLYKNLGNVHRSLHNFREARAAYERALASDEAAYGPSHASVAADILNLGNILMETGDLPVARQYYMRAVEVDMKLNGQNHPDVARDLTNLGLVSRELGDLTAAWEYYGQALEINEASYGAEHRAVASSLKNLGELLRKMGDSTSAQMHFKRALEIDIALHGNSHPEVAADYNNLGLISEDKGNIDEARICYRRALNIEEAVYGREHPKVAISVNNLGGLFLKQRERAQAAACYERAHRIFHKVLGAKHPHTQTAMRNLHKACSKDKDDTDSEWI